MNDYMDYDDILKNVNDNRLPNMQLNHSSLSDEVIAYLLNINDDFLKTLYEYAGQNPTKFIDNYTDIHLNTEEISVVLKVNLPIPIYKVCYNMIEIEQVIKECLLLKITAEQRVNFLNLFKLFFIIDDDDEILKIKLSKPAYFIYSINNTTYIITNKICPNLSKYNEIMQRKKLSQIYNNLYLPLDLENFNENHIINVFKTTV
jgi:hypothetical protein